MGGMLSLMGGAGAGQWPTSDEVRNVLDQHVSVLERVCDLLAIIARDDNPDLFEVGQASIAGGAGQVILPVFVVPVGKRVILRRMLTTSPAGSTNFAMYANTSGVPDGGSLRHVIAVPVLAADNLGTDGTVVRGGQQIIAVVQAGAAGACTIRLEGSIMDDGPRTSHTL